jgi:VCBS repeat protein/S-layer family protein
MNFVVRQIKRICSFSIRRSFLKRVTVFFSVAVVGITLIGFRSFEASSASPVRQASGYEAAGRARLSEQVSVQAAGRGTPWVDLSDGRDVIASYTGPQEAVEALEQNLARPLALASADFDADGVPDLVTGYAGPQGGIILIHRGNLDSIYPNSPEAKRRKAEGAYTDSPFLSPARAFAVAVAADFIGAGDFDGDSNWDVVAAARNSNKLYLLSGDGRGALAEPKTIELPGTVTALAVGEINRRDGFDDIVVGVVAADGPKALVFEGPQGALKAAPEVFALRAEVASFALGQLVASYEMDLAIAAGNELMIVHGRDRKLSLNEARLARAGPAQITTRSFAFTVKSVAVGDFTGSGATDVALLGDDGAISVLGTGDGNAKQKSSIKKITVQSHKVLAEGNWSEGAWLVRARVASTPFDSLVVVDSGNRRVQIISEDPASKLSGSAMRTDESGAGALSVPLDVDGSPVAALPMRLDVDALTDLVLLREGTTRPSLLMTGHKRYDAESILAPQATTFSNTSPITINDTQNPPDKATPYPSTINVSGLSGQVDKLRLRLNGLSHNFPDDIDMMLVGPQGQKLVFMSDVGGFQAISGVTMTFDDDAPTGVPDESAITSGVFKPTDVSPGTGTETFPAPAPAGPYTTTTLSAFNGTNPNGTWRLYIVDDEAFIAGSISGGWSLIFGANSPLVVTNTNDSGAGSLRQAILDANSAPGLDTITFNIGSGLKTISPATDLPNTTGPVVIDGTTQPGYSGTPLIQLSGGGARNIGLYVVGGSSTVKGLVVNGFTNSGIRLESSSNIIQGNYIGTNSTGTNTADTTAVANAIGVFIGGDGVTTNDTGDGDTGPNNLQNYPVLTSAITNGTSITIQGTLGSTIDSMFILNFFASPSCDGSGNGEGKTYLGALNVTTDGSGNATIDTTFNVSITASQVITATAMTASGSSSEFSTCRPVTCMVTLDRDHQSFAGNGGTGAVNITSSCDWTASTTSTFITITSGSSGTGNGTVQYSVAANAGSTIRSDTITIAGQTFTVYQGINFLDVPSDHLFYNQIGKLSARGITVGCGGGNFCPEAIVTREQMAVFIIRGIGEFNPPTPGSQRYDDVPPTNVFYNFIDRMGALGITSGCSAMPPLYCPSVTVTRGQMAVFLVTAFGL